MRPLADQAILKNRININANITIKMPQAKRNVVPDLKGVSIERFLKEIWPKAVAKEGVNFFHDSFQRRGFINKGFERWPARKNDDTPGRAVLVKGGDLRRSVREAQASEQRVEVVSDTPYSKIHNEGGEVNIPVTEQSRAYFWAMWYATKQEKYKAMALTRKKAFKAKVPRRQFMGNSDVLNERLKLNFINSITRIMKEAS